MNAATRSLAIEYAKKGIRVNAVALGVIKTPMHSAEYNGLLDGLHPLGRMGETSDITNAILFLDSAPSITRKSCTLTVARAPAVKRQGFREIVVRLLCMTGIGADAAKGVATHLLVDQIEKQAR